MLAQTTVINIRQSGGVQRDKEVYVGRRNAGSSWLSAPWGNPFLVGVHGTRAECIESFREWLLSGRSLGNNEATVQRREWILKNVHTLRGRTLVCFCKPKACHADVLVEMADT